MATEIDVDAFVEFEAAAGVRSGLRVLDVATGPGQVAARAAGRGATVVGLDVKIGSGRKPGLSRP